MVNFVLITGARVRGVPSGGWANRVIPALQFTCGRPRLTRHDDLEET